MISYGRRTNSISEGGKASSEEAQYTMEASGQRQATKAGSINAWVAHSKYGGNHDRNAMGTRIMISLGRHCHADTPCFFFPSPFPVFVLSSFQKAVFKGCHCGCCSYIFAYLLSCIIRKSSTFMVARLLMCIIVSCHVDRKTGWWPLWKSSLALAYLPKKPTGRIALTATVPLVPFFETIRH